MAKLDYDELNSTIRYLMFSVFAVKPGVLDTADDARAAVVDETATFLKRQEDSGVVVRGLYDVAGMRADADFMMWTHAPTVEALQKTYSDFRRTTTLGRVSMDMITVDLTPVPDAGIGSEAVLWGRAAKGTVLPVDEVAHAAGTIAIRFPSSTARSISCSRGTTSLIRPIRSASSASK